MGSPDEPSGEPKAKGGLLDKKTIGDVCGFGVLTCGTTMDIYIYTDML